MKTRYERLIQLAVRITIVIAQAAKQHGRTSDFEEQLLTRVMFENNLDAVLVGPLEQMEVEGTDALCLSKIPAGSVVLGWLPIAEAETHIARLSLPWTLEVQAGQNPTQRVRYRQLSLDQTVDQVLQHLVQILKVSNTKTLQISLPTTKRKSASAEPSHPHPNGQRSEAEIPKLNQLPTVAIDYAATLNAANQSAIVPRLERSTPLEKDDLDRLVDDLESLDL